MPIVASRGIEIRRLLGELANPRRREGAVLRLRALGSRVVPHVAEELGRLDAEARRALVEALKDVETEDARALRKRLLRAPAAERAGGSEVPRPVLGRSGTSSPGGAADEGVEASALRDLRALPPPRGGEPAAVSRERGEAHLALARTGSLLARKDLLLSLNTLDPKRARLYCEAAGLIGDAAFLASLARIVPVRPEAGKAIAAIASREGITARSRILRDLEAGLRPAVARALVGL